MPEVSPQAGELHKVTVTEWIDGDTFHGTYKAKVETRTIIKLPWQPKKAIEIVQTGEAVIPVVVRVWGINTIETHGATKIDGLKDKAAAVLLAPAGTVVKAAAKSGGEEKYGRFLAQVFLPDGREFAKVMIASGHGLEYFGGARR